VGGHIIKPVEFLDALISRNMQRNAHCVPDQESWEIHFAIGSGTKDGVATRVRCDVTVKPDPMYAPYVDACTSMNASIASQLILLSASRPGVWSPEEYFDVERYFTEVRKRNMSVDLTVESCS
jgi:hypothetical protein